MRKASRLSLSLRLLWLILVPVALAWVLYAAKSAWPAPLVAPVWLALALAVNQIALATFAVRMRLVLSLWNIHIRWLAALRIHLESLFYFFLLPMTIGTEVSRFLKIRASVPGAPPKQVAGGLLLDRALGAVAALASAALCLPFLDLHSVRLPSVMIVVLGAAAAALALVVVLAWPRSRRLLRDVWLLTIGRRASLAAVFVLSMAMHLLFALGIALLGRGLGLPITLLDTCFAVSGGMLLVAVPVSLAGLGPAEAGAVGLFMALGYEPATALVAGTLPYFARLIGAIQGGIWELAESGTSFLNEVKGMLAKRQHPQLP